MKKFCKWEGEVNFFPIFLYLKFMCGKYGGKRNHKTLGGEGSPFYISIKYFLNGFPYGSLKKEIILIRNQLVY